MKPLLALPLLMAVCGAPVEPEMCTDEFVQNECAMPAQDDRTDCALECDNTSGDECELNACNRRCEQDFIAEVHECSEAMGCPVESSYECHIACSSLAEVCYDNILECSKGTIGLCQQAHGDCVDICDFPEI